MDASVADSLAEGRTVYDFMRGQERYKTSYANGASTTLDLYAASGAVLAARDWLYLAARSRARAAEVAGGRSQRVVAAARRAREKLGS
jgi:CelD/BcsL family acetyltransferase involved in cellulose biosynthesis